MEIKHSFIDIVYKIRSQGLIYMVICHMDPDPGLQRKFRESCFEILNPEFKRISYSKQRKGFPWKILILQLNNYRQMITRKW